jgi:hypothetical protein
MISMPRVSGRELFSVAQLRRLLMRVLVDEMIDAYVEWREERDHVNAAYVAWSAAVADEAGLAFVAYSAALDREEQASLTYQDAVLCLGQAEPRAAVSSRTGGP